MSYKVGVVCIKRPISLDIFENFPKDTKIFWFSEIEACFSFLLTNSLDKIFFDSLAQDGINFLKYKELILQLSPTMEFVEINMVAQTPMNKINFETIHFPYLDELFAHGELFPVFQPIMRSEQEKIIPIGYECLSRLNYQGRFYPPDFLLSYAQEKLKLKYYDKLCAQKALAGCPVKDNKLIFINLRPITLLDEDFLEWFLTLLTKSNCSPSQIVIEITEQYCLFAQDTVKDVCNKLTNNKIKLALDDFGYGISNLGLLELMRPDFIKISGNLVNLIMRDTFKQKIIKALAEFASALEISLIVENVENESQWHMLKSLGVKYVQGFLFSKPLPKEEILSMLN